MGRYGDRLGDYVHLHYKNYQKYGLARKGKESLRGKTSKSVDSLSDYVQEVRDELKNSISKGRNQQALAGIQHNLNLIMGGSSDISTQTRIEEAREGIAEFLKQIYYGLRAEDIDWETLSIKPSAYGRITKIKAPELLKIQTLKNSNLGQANVSYVKALEKHIKEITDGINSMANDVKKSNKTVVDLEKRLVEIQKQIQYFEFEGKRIKVTENYQNFTKELGELASDVFKSISMKHLKGDLGETVFAAAAAMLGQFGDKSLDDLLEQFSAGSSRGGNIILDSNISKSADQAAIFSGSGYKRNAGDFGWEIKSDIVKGKIDTIIQAEDIDIKASVKNYNFNSAESLSLVKKTDLFYLLQTRAEFVNHYLNQAVHSTNKYGKRVGPSTQTILKANQYMRQMFILAALAGGGLRTNPVVSGKMANVFAINDSSQRCGFRVMTMESVYAKLVQNNSFLNNVQVTGSPSINRKAWENKWAKSDNLRITNLLSQLKAYKLSASVPINQLKL